VSSNSCDTDPLKFVAVTVYTVASCKDLGFPDNVPVTELNSIPEGALGLIEKLETYPPVELTVNPEADPAAAL
jgi:hypothetical protein